MFKELKKIMNKVKEGMKTPSYQIENINKEKVLKKKGNKQTKKTHGQRKLINYNK